MSSLSVEAQNWVLAALAALGVALVWVIRMGWKLAQLEKDVQRLNESQQRQERLLESINEHLRGR